MNYAPHTRTRTLDRALMARVNRVAHAQAIRQEAQIKADLLRRLQSASDDGVPMSGIHAMIARLEETSPID